MEKVQIVILAAGKGKRMKSELPKVLIPINGKSMIERLIQTSIKSGLTKKPVVVVSESNQQQIQEKLGNSCFYVVQKEQLGTGHAVLCTKNLLQNNVENVLVMYGDHSFVTPATLEKLVAKVQEGDHALSMATTKVNEFSGWQKTFFDFGRIIRNEQGDITEIVEKKDATDEQLKITEVNPAYYCFNAKWLWHLLSEVKNNNSQAEYYLTDVVKLAIKSQRTISSCLINPKEALGVNDPEQLLFAQNLRKLKTEKMIGATAE